MRSSKRTLHHEDVAGLHGDRLRREALPHPAIARVHDPPALVLNEDLRGTQDVPGRQEPAKRAVHFERGMERDRKSTRLNSSHSQISYAVFCLKKKNTTR